MSARLPEPTLAAVEKWAKRSACSRSEAIRRLVEAGLKAKPTVPLYTKKAATKAAKIAERHIDPLIEPSATVEERHSRKKRLIKGPAEFREIRADLPKPGKR